MTSIIMVALLVLLIIGAVITGIIGSNSYF